MRHIRNLACAALAVAAMGLGACANGQGGVPGAPGTPDVGAIVSEIQQAAVTACSFQPTIATVSSIIGTFTSVGAQIDSVNQIAAQICAAIAVPKSARRGGAAPQFCDGPARQCVPIHGKWVGR